MAGGSDPNWLLIAFYVRLGRDRVCRGARDRARGRPGVRLAAAERGQRQVPSSARRSRTCAACSPSSSARARSPVTSGARAVREPRRAGPRRPASGSATPAPSASRSGGTQADVAKARGRSTQAEAARPPLADGQGRRQRPARARTDVHGARGAAGGAPGALAGAQRGWAEELRHFSSRADGSLAPAALIAGGNHSWRQRRRSRLRMVTVDRWQRSTCTEDAARGASDGRAIAASDRGRAAPAVDPLDICCSACILSFNTYWNDGWQTNDDPAARDRTRIMPAPVMLVGDADTLKAISDPTRMRLLEVHGDPPGPAWSVKELAGRPRRAADPALPTTSSSSASAACSARSSSRVVSGIIARPGIAFAARSFPARPQALRRRHRRGARGPRRHARRSLQPSPGGGRGLRPCRRLDPWPRTPPIPPASSSSPAASPASPPPVRRSSGARLTAIELEFESDATA